MPKPIMTPSAYAPAFAVGYSEAGDFSLVDGTAPLPVRAVASPAPAPLTGITATSVVAGPFVPVAGRTVMLTLSGTWQGRARVLRSTDGAPPGCR